MNRGQRLILALAGAAMIGGGAKSAAPAQQNSAPIKITAAPSASDADLSLIMKPGREFTKDSYVHRRLPDNAEIDPNSAGYVQDLLRQIKAFYGVANVNFHEYSPPLYIVPANQPTVRVKAWDRNNPKWAYPPLQEQWMNVPLPENFQSSPGTDQEAIVYQPSAHHYYEFWLMQKTGEKVTNSAGQQVDEWGARWGGRIEDLRKSPGYFPTTKAGAKFGVAATGLCELAGLMTVKEQERGVINHAIHVAIPEALYRSRWSFPAQRSDGQIPIEKNPNAIPEGTIFRLPANLNLDAIDMDPYARMIARAVQRYGMVVRDRAGAVALYAENPANRYAQDPYTRAGGIFRCPGGVYGQSCWPNSNGRLRGFPWDRLQVLKLQMNQ